MRSFCARFICSVFLLFSLSDAAFAEGFALYEYSARGVALGGTLVARKPDASAVAYNPALMARLPGINVMAGFSTVTPMGKMDTTDEHGNKETTELRKSTWAIPHIYYTHQINDNFTFGLGEFTRYGLGFEYPHNWPGRFNIYQVALKSVSVNPNIAWAATDKLSLAAGMEIVYVDLDLKKRSELSLGGGATMEVDSNIQKATDTGLGWNVAGHYQFNDEWAAGLLYRSQVRVRAKGDVEYTLVGNSPGAGNIARAVFDGNFNDGKAHSTVILPDSFSGGVSFTPVKELSIEVGATWTRWSTFRNLNIHLPQGEARSKKHWHDAWRLGVGVEYSLFDWLDLRAGYVWDESPMDGQYQDYLVPTKNRNIWSFGAGFSWEAWKLDLAYAFIDAGSRKYKANDETKVLTSRSNESNSTHVVSMSLSYSF